MFTSWEGFNPMSTLRRQTLIFAGLVASFCCLLGSRTAAQAPSPSEKQQVLWQKLEAAIADVDQNLDGSMGIAILDLTDGHKYLLHANDVFAQASSIKVCVLAELYRQAEQGKLK